MLCFWLSNAPGNGRARAQAMRMVLKQEARAQGPRSSQAARFGPQDLHQVLSNSAATSCDRAFVVLWGVDVVLLDSIVAVPKSSFVTRQTATLASISVPPAGPFARRPRACLN